MTSPLRILIGCETSGVVRRAMAALGHDVWSCDLLPAEDGSNRHIIADVRDLLGQGWDMLCVMHPPCTRLCNSGVRWLSDPPKNPPNEARPGSLETAVTHLRRCCIGDGMAMGRACGVCGMTSAPREQ